MPDFSYGASEKLQSEDWNILSKKFIVKRWGHEREVYRQNYHLNQSTISSEYYKCL